MRRNSVYKWITKNQPTKDLIIYQYGDKNEYIIKPLGGSCYSTHHLNGEQVKDSKELQTVWINSNILAVYEEENIFIQVNWNK